MVPASFDGENAVLGAPGSMSAAECEPLSVRRGVTGEGIPVVVSCWKPTAAELEEINRTGRVWLMVWGVTMPPACVCGERPF
jgi:hypothetical protein